MKVLLWVISALVALFFLAVGGLKLFGPAADLAANARGVPVGLLRVAGAAEILGALGLILPAATRILPILTPVAAAALALQMVAAAITNIIVGAYSTIPTNIVLAVVLAGIAWLRFGRYAVQPRSGVSGATPEAV